VKSPKDFLAEAARRPPGEPLELTIRELLNQWGAKRRGFWIVDRITED
jgi:hypothetical protein